MKVTGDLDLCSFDEALCGKSLAEVDSRKNGKRGGRQSEDILLKSFAGMGNGKMWW
jgi:hypothetical protein